ncbi:hypothetical protein ASPCAL13258 [Aspergillus calidoustus]|uniref:Uncharacterized protein n=1 Tax=Aspergillus calidoustus TaxID=454130 RepID=A0A0U4ZKL5_ASPCI|nr:hypothetical protein ASPCAL13258 [Aspergillus calidoustus]
MGEWLSEGIVSSALASDFSMVLTLKERLTVRKSVFVWPGSFALEPTLQPISEVQGEVPHEVMMNYVRLLEECEEGGLQTVQAMLYSGVSPNFPEGLNLEKWKEYAYRPLDAVTRNNDIPIVRVLWVLGAR